MGNPGGEESAAAGAPGSSVEDSGYGGQQVRGWLLLPRPRSGRLPCVVEYIGYGGGRGLPLDWLTLAPPEMPLTGLIGADVAGMPLPCCMR